ncbi:amidohydrolase family protein [Acidobacteriota bacterium]
MNRRFIIGFILFWLALCFVSCQKQEFEFDLVITNAKIIDGAGKPAFSADIGIQGDSIVEIGHIKGKKAVRIIDANGFVVAPGFIDMHTHCDWGLGENEIKANLNYLTQGVTTVVTGNCGNGNFKIPEITKLWTEQGIGTNAVHLVGFGTIRREILGDSNITPTPEDLDKMKSILDQALRDGAWGMSTGLMYIPDRYASTEEVIEMAKVLNTHGAIYSSHIRNEEAYFLDAVRETIRIGKESGVRINVSHMKAAGKSNWGKMKEAIRLINEAQSAGMIITGDIYPYNFAATMPIFHIFNVPKEAQSLIELEKRLVEEESASTEQNQIANQLAEELAKALRDPSMRKKIRKLTLEGDPEKVNWIVVEGWDNIAVVSAKKNTHLLNKILSDLATEENRDPFDIAVDLFLEEKNDLVVSVCTMCEEDIHLAMSQDWVMVSSDGGTIPYGEGVVHPRTYGSFPRFFRKYIREDRIGDLLKAIHMTSALPAEAIGLDDRGQLLEGYKADIVIFDPEKICDNATYLDSHRYSSGIEYVIVNGKLAIDQGKYTNTLNGRVLLHESLLN